MFIALLRMVRYVIHAKVTGICCSFFVVVVFVVFCVCFLRGGCFGVVVFVCFWGCFCLLLLLFVCFFWGGGGVGRDI